MDEQRIEADGAGAGIGNRAGSGKRNAVGSAIDKGVECIARIKRRAENGILGAVGKVRWRLLVLRGVANRKDRLFAGEGTGFGAQRGFRIASRPNGAAGAAENDLNLQRPAHLLHATGQRSCRSNDC